MRILLLVLILIVAVSFATAQPAAAVPMTQAEYVRMLYEVEQSPSKVSELVEMVRIRGIDFKMTSGLRTLTKSKTKSDADLQRTVEEAERRNENPESAKRPTSAESAALVLKTRENSLHAIEEMPDFVVKQRIRRSIAYAGTNNFQGLDRLIVSVSYRADGQEEYRVLSQNGVNNADSGRRNKALDEGFSTYGDFVISLAMIFKSENETDFSFLDTAFLRGRNAVVYEFSIDREKQAHEISSGREVTSAGTKGKIWIDREAGRVLRIESHAIQIPIDFPVTAVRRLIDYEWVSINGQSYLLPSISDVRLTAREGTRSFESRNFIEFKDYQKYGTEVLILDDDADFVDGPKPIPFEPDATDGPPPLKPPPPPLF